MAQAESLGALSGVRVLDLADETAIFGTKLLADLGADVLRIEPPQGDPIRRLGPFVSSESLSHWWYNAGKRSAVLDLSAAAGQHQLIDLARNADIIVETGGFGIDLRAIRADRPGLTVVSVSPFGRSGPRRNWQGADLIAWATGGGMTLTGLPGRAPLRPNWAIASQIAGLNAAIGGLAGFYQARATGHGAHFDLSCQEALLSLQETLIGLYVYQDQIQTRQGVENPIVAPYGVFPTRDGSQVLMAVITQGQWSTLTGWMTETGEVEPWILDEALLPMGRRATERPRIHESLGRWTQQFDRDDLVREANWRRIPCAPISTPLDVLSDEQLQARGFFVPVEQPLLGRAVLFPGHPYRFEGAPPIRPAPAFGVSGVGGGVSGAPEDSLAEGPTLAWRPRPDSPSSQPRLAGEGSPERSTPDTPYPTPSPVPLAGLKVVDFTWALAGPTGTRVLADLGAEMVKIEPRDVGDIARGLPPHWRAQPDLNRSGFYHRLNRNKRNLTLDLKKPEAIAIVKRLAAWADVIVDNFGAGVMERVGLGPGVLFAINPALVQASLSGYGQEGPTRSYPSFAQVSQARGGLTYSTGYPDGAISGIGISLGDTGAGLQLAVAILAAIELARRTGRGTRIDMSQLEAAVLFLGPALLDAAVNGRAFSPRGSLLEDRDAAPHAAFPARGDDRWVAIGVLTEDQWRRLTEAMGRPDLAQDPRFSTATDRVANAEALDALVGAWTADQDAHELAERLQAAGVPAGVVQDAVDLLERDPHLAARGFYAQVDEPETGPVVMDTLPLRWMDGPVPIRTPAPLIGEH
ncbi:MAG TPA: CoA transferase, partial [Dehalococcoidia bacterium]|nr:CoA transferase [Dehalococcoidia bacterium]